MSPHPLSSIYFHLSIAPQRTNYKQHYFITFCSVPLSIHPSILSPISISSHWPPLTLLVPQQLRRATSTSTTLSLSPLTQLRCSPVARICSSNREWRRWRPPWSIPDATTCRRSVSSARPWSRYLPSSAVSSSLAAGAPSPRWSLRAPHNGQWSPRSWTGTDTWPVACWIFPIPATGPRPHLGRTCV